MFKCSKDFYIRPLIVKEHRLSNTPLVFESQKFEIPPLKVGGVGDVYPPQSVFLHRLLELLLRGFKFRDYLIRKGDELKGGLIPRNGIPQEHVCPIGEYVNLCVQFHPKWNHGGLERSFGVEHPGHGVLPRLHEIHQIISVEMGKSCTHFLLRRITTEARTSGIRGLLSC